LDLESFFYACTETKIFRNHALLLTFKQRLGCSYNTYLEALVPSVNENPRVAKFERDAERNRAELSETVGDLKDKITETVSPAALKREVKDYVQQSGAQLVETIQRKAYDNPLQAIAVAAGLGYPLWRMFANVPIPILMAGAGIALARPSRERSGLQQARASTTSIAKHTTGKVSEAMAEATDQITSGVKDATESIEATIGGAAASTVRGAQVSADEVLNAVDRYPLVVGAIGVGLGALIGAAIPRSSAETELVGDLSDEVQGRAGEIVKGGVDAAKEAASEVYRKAAEEADKQGLTGEQMREGARNIQDQLLGTQPKTTSRRSGKEQ
jgi:ElaB/YqjD/DUF883 family membrane-anchored ribosome-binding protein